MCSGTVAGPSGTTANVLVLATLFGFNNMELVVLRLTMCAWMLVTDDHSFFEIMLGADPHMPPGLQMSVGLHDLGQLWPLSFTAATSGGVFRSSDVWNAVAAAMRTQEGARLLSAMSVEAREYVAALLTPPPPSTMQPSVPSALVIGLACGGCLLLLTAVAVLVWRRRARRHARAVALIGGGKQDAAT